MGLAAFFSLLRIVINGGSLVKVKNNFTNLRSKKLYSYALSKLISLFFRHYSARFFSINLQPKTEKRIMNKVDTVVFDLDGTLLDTLDDLAGSVNYALEKHGLPLRTEQEVRSFLGNGIRFLMEKAVGERVASNEERFLPVFQSFRTHYVDHCLDATRPYEGVVEMLRALKEKGFKLAIVSNKLQPAVTELNEKFFRDVISVAIGESADVRRKPFPDSVLKAMGELRSTCEQTVYVGDSEVDIETAKAVGIPCLSVLWGFRDEDFLRGKYPDAHFVWDVQDLERMVGLL